MSGRSTGRVARYAMNEAASAAAPRTAAAIHGARARGFDAAGFAAASSPGIRDPLQLAAQIARGLPTIVRIFGKARLCRRDRARAVRPAESGRSAAVRLSESSRAGSRASSPRRPCAPVSISNSMQPNANRSVRASASMPSICSGAMYQNVPRMLPAAVIAAGGVVGTIDRPLTATTGTLVFARPKSSSLAPDFVSITLPGLRSRWTMPAR